MPCPPQLQNIIHNMEQLLDTMNDPTKDPKQHLLHTNNIGRINDMLQKLHTNPMYIEVKRENGPNSTEIENSVANIQKRMSENLASLRAWKTTHTKTRRQEEAISIFINEEIMQHFDQLGKENHSHTNKLIPKEIWKAKALSNLHKLSNLRALVTIYDVTYGTLNIDTLGSKLNTLQNVTLPQIQALEEENRRQHVRN